MGFSSGTNPLVTHAKLSHDDVVAELDLLPAVSIALTWLLARASFKGFKLRYLPVPPRVTTPE